MDSDAAVGIVYELLDHYDRIAAVRQWISRVDDRKAPGAERDRRCVRCTEAVSGRKGYPVHRTGGVVRRTDRGVNGACRYPSAGILNRNALCLRSEAALPQKRDVVLSCLVKRHIC